MRARAPTYNLRAQFDRLNEARLAATSGAQPDDAPAWPEPVDYLAKAERIAAGLYGLVEMPQNGPRQPRAVLRQLADIALRRAE